MFFLSKTHLGKVKAEILRRRLGFDHLTMFESDGRSGGLLMLWRKDTRIVEQGVTENFIDVIIQGDVEWRLTGIYGEPRWEHKDKTWEASRSLNGMIEKPWLVLGDFNEILFNHEKEGGRPRPQRYMQAFHNALVDCDLSDMGFMGDSFTWQRGKVRERLDHGVTNAPWNLISPGARLVNSGMTKSDHRPLIIDTETHSANVIVRGGREGSKQDGCMRKW